MDFPEGTTEGSVHATKTISGDHSKRKAIQRRLFKDKMLQLTYKNTKH